MKKNNKKAIIIIFLILIIILIFSTSFYFIRRNLAVSKIDFSLCESSCDYKVLLNNRVYKLKYVKTDSEHGVYPGFEGRVYLNNVNIITSAEYGEISKVRVYKDLLIFEEHAGTSADGDTIKIYNKNGKLLKDIYILDEKTGMHVSNYYNDNYNSACMEIKDDNLIVYGTMKYDSGSLEINGEFYEGRFNTDLIKMVDNGTLLTTDPFIASYKISYDGIKNNEDLKLYKTIKTVGYVIEETN